MADGFQVTLVDPARVYADGEQGPFPFDLFECKCLAQGDSWFSIGAFPPGLTTNVLVELRLAKSAAIVNCARPGKVLAHFVDRVTEPMFLRLLTGKLAFKWDALLLSGGGNDLIDAATVGPDQPRHLRLLLKPDERIADPSTGADFVCNEGWSTFATHFTAVFELLLKKRAAGVNKTTSMVFHNYAPVMPRPSGGGFGTGPWLQPSLDRYGVPQTLWFHVAEELLGRLDALLRELIAKQNNADPNSKLHLVDTRAAGLVVALPTASGRSEDWQNEIHPTSEGYAKAAAKWRTTLDSFL